MNNPNPNQNLNIFDHEPVVDEFNLNPPDPDQQPGAGMVGPIQLIHVEEGNGNLLQQPDQEGPGGPLDQDNFFNPLQFVIGEEEEGQGPNCQEKKQNVAVSEKSTSSKEPVKRPISDVSTNITSEGEIFDQISHDASLNGPPAKQLSAKAKLIENEWNDHGHFEQREGNLQVVETL